MPAISSAVARTACTVVSIPVAPGDGVRAGDTVAVVEIMKMEHAIGATCTGVVTEIHADVGSVVGPGEKLVSIEERVVQAAVDAPPASGPGGFERSDLAEVERRRALLLDAARPAAVGKVHRLGRRTARENLSDLVDPDSFEEYGGFMYAAQTARRSRDDLIANTPADGIVGGLCRINGELFDDDTSRCAVMSYDYTVLAGTQGFRGHQKKDRLLDIADRLSLPVVLFAEGGGGRPGDTDAPVVAGLDVMSFAWMARLSGSVPTVAVVSGRCFAGNAALAGVCDVIIATRDANLGMAGPAMIEGGGLGVFSPEEVGPMSVQTTNGVVDLLVDDDAAAVSAVKTYLSYFQGSLHDWECAEQARLRDLVPENRKRVYPVRDVIEVVADTGSVLELRESFGTGIVTALARLEGRPLGVIANDPAHLGGVIDSDGADKAARFMQLCNAHGLPIVFLCDTPGFMVGPEAETTAQVRHFSRMYVAGAALRVPFATVVLRKAVGLGAMAMAGGSFHAPLLIVSWPTGEMSGMGIEGAVRLGARRELDSIDDPEDRELAYRAKVDAMYERSKALNAAAHNEVDDVIDPASTRSRLVNLLRSCPADHTRGERRRTGPIDTW